MKKFLSLLFLSLLVCVGGVRADSVYLQNAGNLSNQISYPGNITELTISGNMDSRDFEYLRNNLTYLRSLDLSQVQIVSYSWISVSGELPSYAFKNLWLEKLVLPSTITKIGDNACSYISIKSIIIPATVTSIGNSAFGGCGNLKSIVIPNSVTSIGSGAFEYCYDLTDITVQSNNANYSSLDGVLYNKDKTTLIQFPGSKAGEYSTPNTVTTVADGAFKYCKRLKKINISNSVISIGSSALVFCDSLTQISLGSGVKSIGFINSSNKNLIDIVIDAANTNFSSLDGVLFDKNKLTLLRYPAGKKGSYTIPGSVTNVGESSFYSCGELTSVVIPNSVTTIGSSAFSYCNKLKNVSIGSGVKSIGDYAFGGSGLKVVKCLSLTPPTIISNPFPSSVSVFVPSTVAQTNYKAASGWSALPIFAPGFTTSAISLSGLISAPAEASSDQKYFTVSGAFLPGDVVVTAPANYEISSTSGSSFAAATQVTLSPVEGVLSGFDTIFVCLKPGLALNTYTDKVTIACSGLTSQYVTLNGIVRNTPDAIDVRVAGTLGSLLSESEKKTITKLKITGNIDVRDFKCMRDSLPLLSELDIKSVDIKECRYSAYPWQSATDYAANAIPDDCWSYKAYNYAGKKTLKSIVLPDNITSIGSNAFNGCTGLTAITIPSSVTALGSSAFSGCTNLKTATLSAGLSTIPDGCFSSCSALEAIDIPSAVTSIGITAFYSCSGLLSISIPASVTSIGTSAFSGCSGYKMTCLPTTPPTTTLSEMMGINSSYYSTETNNNAVVIKVPTGQVDAYKNKWGTATGVIYIDNEVAVVVNVPTEGKLATSIYEQTKIHPTTVTKLTVTGVLGSADFSYMQSNMKLCYDIDLEGVSMVDFPTSAFSERAYMFSLKLPYNLKTIGSNAFYKCRGIRSVSIPNSVTKIGASAFYECNAINTLKLSDGLTTLGESAFYNCKNLPSITIPNGVISIPASCFNGCEGIKAVLFPNSVTTIGNSAFSGCRIDTIYLPNTVTVIGDEAFSSCPVKSIILSNSLTSIGRSAFSAYYLDNIDFPNTLTSIGSYAFSSAGFKSLSLPNSLKTIGSYAFRYCDSLKNIIIPNRITEISAGLFQGCDKLASIDIPANVSTIGEYAFGNCIGLKSVSLSPNVSSIGNTAFSGCSNITQITSYRLTPPALGTNVFSGISQQTCKLRIQQDADFEAYFNAPQWGYFLNVERINLTGKLGDSNEDGAINIVDVVNVVNYILEKPVTKFNMLYSDINKDGSINVIDVVQLVKMITSAPANAPALRSASAQLNTGYWDVANGLFSAHLPGGMRGFDVAYTGSLRALPALDGFVTCAYTKNGEQHLLGYTTNNALSTDALTQLFGLSDNGAITAMTFVGDNGSPITLIQSTATDIARLAVNELVVVENGMIRCPESCGTVIGMQLYNAGGALVATSATGTLALPAQAKGICMLRVKTTRGSFSRKFVF